MKYTNEELHRYLTNYVFEHDSKNSSKMITNKPTEVDTITIDDKTVSN